MEATVAWELILNNPDTMPILTTMESTLTPTKRGEGELPGSRSSLRMSRSYFRLQPPLTPSSILKLILIVAFALVIAAGVMVGRNLDSESTRTLIANLLKASYVLALGES